MLTTSPKGVVFHPKTDGRGKAPSTKKGPWDLIDSHIESFNPTISHYRREHAPNVRYLPSDITIRSMHEDWKIKYPQHKEISYESYRRRIKKKKISFTKLGCEECESCEEFNLHEHKDKNNLERDCTICQSWKKHIDLATESRKLYRLYAEGKFEEEGLVCYSADLQKLLCYQELTHSKQ